MISIKAHWDVPQHREDADFNMKATQEWFDLRHAKITGTGLVRVLGGAATRKRYLQGVAYSILRKPADAEEDGWIGKDAARGNFYEPFAIEALKKKYPTLPKNRECAFIDITPVMGISPDYVNEELTVAAEIKCFQAESMAEVVFNGIEKKNLPQVLSYFLIPTIKVVLYAVFCPAIDTVQGKDLLHVIELRRSDYLSEIADLQMAVIKASEEVINLRKML